MLQATPEFLTQLEVNRAARDSVRPLSFHKAKALADISKQAESISAEFLTPGQFKQSRYREKAREAREALSIIDAGGSINPADYPACEEEWPARAPTFEDFIRLVLLRAQHSARASGKIERAQAEGVAAIEMATTSTAVESAKQQALTALNAIRQET